jgi:hypothetical protein
MYEFPNDGVGAFGAYGSAFFDDRASHAEVRLPDIRVFEELSAGSGGGDPSGFHDIGFVSQFETVLDVLFHEQN